MLVELHSNRALISTASGLCGAWDATKERFAVTLASGTLAVKPANLRRAPPVPEAAAAEATELAHEAARLLSQARGGTNSTLQCGAAPRLSAGAHCGGGAEAGGGGASRRGFDDASPHLVRPGEYAQ